MIYRAYNIVVLSLIKNDTIWNHLYLLTTFIDNPMSQTELWWGGGTHPTHKTLSDREGIYRLIKDDERSHYPPFSKLPHLYQSKYRVQSLKSVPHPHANNCTCMYPPYYIVSLLYKPNIACFQLNPLDISCLLVIISSIIFGGTVQEGGVYFLLQHMLISHHQNFKFESGV